VEDGEGYHAERVIAERAGTDPAERVEACPKTATAGTGAVLMRGS
jgi:hypothetical protein